MMLALIIFILPVIFFVWRGYQKGFLSLFTGLVAWIVAYPATLYFFKPVVSLITNNTSMKGLLVYLIACALIFILTSIAVVIIINILTSVIPENTAIDISSKIGGTGLGLVMGTVIGLVAVYCADLFIKPTTQDSAIQTYAKEFVSTTTTSVVKLTVADPAAVQITKVFVEDPQAMLNHVQNITNDGQLKTLLEKPEFQTELHKANVDQLMQNQDFQTLLQNKDMQALISAHDSNITDSNATNNKAAEKNTARKFIVAWQRMETLKQDPRVIEILNNEEFQEQAKDVNKLPLLMNPKSKELADIIFSSESKPSVATNTKASNYNIESLNGTHKPAVTTDEDTNTEKKIYRWTDENGNLHYSDSPTKH